MTMMNQLSIDAVAKARFDQDFCHPLYDSYCFSRIPQTIRGLLTGKPEGGLPIDVLGGAKGEYDFVLLILLDSFGWRFFEHYAEKFPFLQRFLQNGVVSKITTQFPSTTAAHITSINTGLEVGQSGVYEWFYYEPLVDQVIAPLLFSHAGEKAISSLSREGIEPERFFPFTTFYEQLGSIGIHSYVLQPIGISGSPYSNCMFRGAYSHPYQHLANGLKEVLRLYETKPEGEKRYVYFYFGEIDALGHHEGLFSDAHEAMIEKVLRALEERFWQKISSTRKKAACIVSADHGMIEINPQHTRYINLELPQIVSLTKKNRSGKLIVPAGSCRDFFLHIEEEKLDEARHLLTGYLQDQALIVSTSELIAKGFFGTRPVEKRFLERVGNLVILPRGNGSVWWFEEERFEQKLHGMHGGLTPQEMETIFLFQEMG